MRRERERKSFSLPPPHLCGLTPSQLTRLLESVCTRNDDAASREIAFPNHPPFLPSNTKHRVAIEHKSREKSAQTLDSFNSDRAFASREKGHLARRPQPPSPRLFSRSPAFLPNGEAGSRSRAARNA